MHFSHAPANQDLWVFGYGSLMWRPGFPYCERIPGRLVGLQTITTDGEKKFLFGQQQQDAIDVAKTHEAPNPRRDIAPHACTPLK